MTVEQGYRPVSDDPSVEWDAALGVLAERVSSKHAGQLERWLLLLHGFVTRRSRVSPLEIPTWAPSLVLFAMQLPDGHPLAQTPVLTWGEFFDAIAASDAPHQLAEAVAATVTLGGDPRPLLFPSPAPPVRSGRGKVGAAAPRKPG